MSDFNPEIYGRFNLKQSEITAIIILDNCVSPYSNFTDYSFDRDLLRVFNEMHKNNMVPTNRTTKEIAEHLEQKDINQKAKWIAIKERRRLFAYKKAKLILQMLDSGIPYICAHLDCEVCEDLTLDHKFPLSKGGSDELDNFQFLCLPHNSQKGDRELQLD